MIRFFDLYRAGALVVVARLVDDLIATLEAGKASAETSEEITTAPAKEGKPKKGRNRRGRRANRK